MLSFTNGLTKFNLTKEKTTLNEKLMSTTDVDEALKLHGQFERVAAELDMSESRWLEIQEALEK